ncbi:MAG: radical SAM protein [Planctomycetota bacterium]
MPTESPWQAFRQPIHAENRDHLERLWSELPSALRTPTQMVGRQWEGCAATIGAMPRCDFGCTACYLSSEANATPPLPLEAVRKQLRQIRENVGRWGNVQLTDGELTLRDPDDVVALVRVARDLELIPMLMTHGDAFRSDPSLLERLVVEGGLTEMSVHVDTTQRGRSGRGVDELESSLHPIRDEIAELVRDLRRRTGHELRLAATVTVTRANLAGVTDVVRWTLANGDLFRVLSFQPVADVGRTRDRSGVSREELWRAISDGLREDMDEPSSAWNSDQLFGHPGCSHVVMGSVWSEPGQIPRFVPLRDPTDARAEDDLAAFFDRFGGLSFRSDGRALALARAAGVFVAAPIFWVSRGPRWLSSILRRARNGSSARTLTRLMTGRARFDPLAIVTHHFMDQAELESPTGAEREAACVFRVPIDGELVSMCRVNATDVRRRFYASLREESNVLA